MKSYGHDEMKKLLDASFITPKEGDIIKATVIKKTLASAIANATNNFDMDEEKLYVSTIMVLPSRSLTYSLFSSNHTSVAIGSSFFAFKELIPPLF